MDTKDLLIHSLDICKVHAERLSLAIEKTDHLFPFCENTVTALAEENLAYLELLMSRFGKLQDVAGEKVFTFLLQQLGESVSNKTFIDKLNKLEKLEILPDAHWWMDLRKLSNKLTRDYPDNPDFMAKNINKAIIQAKELLVFWESLVIYIEANVLTQPT
ncbi:MAG: hypothetical protein NTX76_02295 [Alphaproteobacteria bacterium]|nr:hypothetical protein [Alphaproteobacteria bacterium]